MTKHRKLFFETSPTWGRVIIFAVAAAVLTAAILICPWTAATSVANIGVMLECWILFALLIIMNCGSALEAGAKTFVFFLISQPLIYLLQVPFSSMGWGLFSYYPRWAAYTVLCFPGAMLAWLVKKGNMLSALILSVATGYLAAMAVYYGNTCLTRFPYPIAAALFCAALAVVLILVLLPDKRTRLVCAAVTIVCAAAMVCYVAFFTSAPTITSDYALPEGEWEITSTDGDVAEYGVDGDSLSIFATKPGVSEVTLTDADGNVLVLSVEYVKGTYDVIVTEK